MIWIADAHRGDGKRFIGRTVETLTAFLELEKSHARIIALPKCQVIRHNSRHGATTGSGLASVQPFRIARIVLQRRRLRVYLGVGKITPVDASSRFA